MKKGGNNRKGFTLTEMMVAVGVFAILSGVATALFTNISRAQKKINLENAIIEDGRYMMERMVRLIRNTTVDYEEYYNQRVLAEFVADKNYGDNYGYYATMFYYPHFNKDEGPTSPSADGTHRYYGAYYNGPIADIYKSDASVPAATSLCQIDRTYRTLDLKEVQDANGFPTYKCPPDTTWTKKPKDGFEIVLPETIDDNMGQNPYPEGNNTNFGAETASAFCDDHKAKLYGTVPKCSGASVDNFTRQNELYLINGEGTRKYILGREKVGANQYALALLEMVGEDTNFNGISDSWKCADGYDCSSSNLLKDDLGRDDSGKGLTEVYKDFVPISPLRADLVDLKFYVAPLEDPRKGFSEREKAAGFTEPQIHPHVTIVMRLRPAQSQLSGIDEPPEIVLQTTVSSRVMGEVESYGP